MRGVAELRRLLPGRAVIRGAATRGTAIRAAITRGTAARGTAARGAAGRGAVPSILQTEAVEGGAACLAMVLAGYGKWVAVEEVRACCGVSRDGTQPPAIISAAESYGLKAEALDRPPDQLGELPLPQIVSWQDDRFVVVTGFSANKVRLNDPAHGPRVLGREAFAAGYSGVAVVFEPGPAFEPSGRAPSVVQSLRAMLAGSHGGVAYLCLASLLLVVPGLIVASAARVFVDYYLVRGLESWLAPLLLGLAATAVLRAGLLGMQGHLLLRLQTKIAIAGSAAFLWRVLRLPIAFFAQRNAAEISAALRLNDQVAGRLTGPLATAALSLTTMVIYAAVMFQYDVQLAALSVLFAAAGLLVLGWVSGLMADRNRRLQVARGRAHAAGLQGLSMLDSYRASGTEKILFERWTGAEAETVDAEQDMALVGKLSEIAPTFFTGLLMTLVLVVGALRVVEGSMTLGMLVAFQMLAGLFSLPVSNLVALGGRLQGTAGSILRLDDLANHPLDEGLDREPPASAAPVRPSGRISVHGVGFGYSPGRLLFQNISLTIEPGSHVAILGKSGSGKSTLAKILIGLIDPWSGHVRYDGADIKQMPWPGLCDAVAYVEQDPRLFTGSIKDNLTLWDDGLSGRQFMAAAKDALAHDVITGRPGAYGAMLAEGGRGISAGEAQRLAIARALAIDPSVVLLDEATSALDTVGEARLLDNLRRRGCTCILITHRASAIRHCDNIFVLDGGQIAQQGRHRDLAEVDGPYRQLMTTS